MKRCVFKKRKTKIVCVSFSKKKSGENELKRVVSFFIALTAFDHLENSTNIC